MHLNEKQVAHRLIKNQSKVEGQVMNEDDEP